MGVLGFDKAKQSKKNVRRKIIFLYIEYIRKMVSANIASASALVYISAFNLKLISAPLAFTLVVHSSAAAALSSAP